MTQSLLLDRGRIRWFSFGERILTRSNEMPFLSKLNRSQQWVSAVTYKRSELSKKCHESIVYVRVSRTSTSLRVCSSIN